MGVLYQFHTADYVVFLGTIAVSLAIGLFHALRGSGQKTTWEYLSGGGQLRVLPVTISILVTFVSAIALLGNPAEVYNYGTQFSLYVIGASVGCVLGALLFVPLFHPLRLTSSFEYFEMRYESKATKYFGVFILLINQTIYNGINIFAPSIALETVTGIKSWISMLICGITVTIFTAFGGLKAVVYTDVFQALVILLGLLTVVIKGIFKLQGFEKVWELNNKWNRLEFFNMNPDPTQRSSFWSVVVVMSILWMCMTTSQPSIQRYSSLPTLKKAKLSLLLNVPGLLLFGSLSCFSGSVAFAYYADKKCDPVQGKILRNPNQILPYFVMELLHNYPGLPGLFVACLFSSALSSLSSSLNSLSAVIWESALKAKLTHLSDNSAANVTKVIVFVFGFLGIGMAFLVKSIGGTLIMIAFSIIGVTAGPIAGMIIIGALNPRTSAKGCVLGALCALAITSWIAVGAKVNRVHSLPRASPTSNCSTLLPKLPLYQHATLNQSSTILPTTLDFTETSIYNNITDSSMEHTRRPIVLRLYGISYIWYPFISVIITCFVGFITSFIPGLKHLSKVDDKLLFVFVRRLKCCGTQINNTSSTQNNSPITNPSHSHIEFKKIDME